MAQTLAEVKANAHKAALYLLTRNMEIAEPNRAKLDSLISKDIFTGSPCSVITTIKDHKATYDTFITTIDAYTLESDISNITTDWGNEIAGHVDETYLKGALGPDAIVP